MGERGGDNGVAELSENLYELGAVEHAMEASDFPP